MSFLAWLGAFLSFALFALFGLMDVIHIWVELDETEHDEGPW